MGSENRKHHSSGCGKVVAIGNLKGGVGKSTVTVNAAACMSLQGKKVCVVDCDVQATSANWLVDGDLDVHVVAMPNDDIRHAKLWLKKVKSLTNVFDVVIIDLPASMSHALASALLISHLVLIPLSPSAVDIHATERMIDALKAASKDRQASPPTALLVPTQVSARLYRSDELEKRMQQFGLPTTVGLRYDDMFQEAFQAYQWIGQFASADRATRDVEDLVEVIETTLLSTATPPILANNGLFGGLSSAMPIADLATNHRESLTWWSRLLRTT